MENPKEEILSVQVDATSTEYLKKTAALASRTFIGSIFFSFIFVSASVVYVLTVDPEKFANRPALYLHIRTSLWFAIGACILMLLQLYQYRRFTKQAHKAVQFTDGEQFNYAFKHLYNSSRLAFAQMAVNIIYGLLGLWVNLTFFAAVRAAGH